MDHVRKNDFRGLATACCILLLCLLAAPAQAQYSFTPSNLIGASPTNPTSLQFGPDGRLYVSQQNGVIRAYTVVREGPSTYRATATETIDLVQRIANHNDDGAQNANIQTRQVTALLVAGTPQQPVLYVSSSDPRIGGGSGGADTNLDTNSGIISRLIRNQSTGSWDKVDLVRGLPRSEENHSVNGMQLDAATNTLYIAVGGFTNAGSPSGKFARITEYALSAAILKVDLDVLNAMPVLGSGSAKYVYDLPTLDDPSRTNQPDGSDPGDPFGGNDGLNQAKLVSGGPVQIFSTGYRNAYDLVIMRSPDRAGDMYSVDNGANASWGGHPENEGPQGNCTNNYVLGEPGSTGAGPNDPAVNNRDNLHLVTPGYYAGHPTPVRGNPAGAGLYTYGPSGVAFRTSKTDPNLPLPADWPPYPVSQANPVECDFRNPGQTDGALFTYSQSTNGIAEYTASNFGGVLEGDLLLASLGGVVWRVVLNAAGDAVVTNEIFASGFGGAPLDVIAQGDEDLFPGTVWTANYAAHKVAIFEPTDYDGTGTPSCSGTYSDALDDDSDGYSNKDEIDNDTDPCSAASRPTDNDDDFASDLNDPDDDNDGIADTRDPFAIDASNGMSTTLPLTYNLLNNDPGTGFYGLGFTGLMSDGTSDYSALFDDDQIVAGGAVGLLTLVDIPPGDALGAANGQRFGFQFGLNAAGVDQPFTIQARLVGPFFNAGVRVPDQSQGFFLGSGDQDNYVKIVITDGIRVVHETAGVSTVQNFSASQVLSAETVDLYLTVDPAGARIQPKYSIDGGPVTHAGSGVTISGDLLAAVRGTYQVAAGKNSALAVGVIATSSGSGTPFAASWDFITATVDPTPGEWELVQASNTPTSRHENAFLQVNGKFYLLGGRGSRPVQVYDPATNAWSTRSSPPLQLHHFQAVELGGLIYVIGAFTGGFPNETPVPNVYIYDPVADTWIVGPEIPAGRRRGAAGAVVRNGKIYVVAGLTNGHVSGWVQWFDEFDPATGQWRTLPDAPRTRDHFHATLVGNKLIAAGGRLTGFNGSTFAHTIAEVDVYDFGSGQWSTLPAPAGNLPTPRGGSTAAVLDGEVIVIGGEGSGKAWDTAEGLDLASGTWRTLAPMNVGRHGTQATVYNGAIYIAAGSGDQGGSPELNSLERFTIGSPATATLTAAPNPLDVGSVQQNETTSGSVQLRNVGSVALDVTGLTITGTNAPDFSTTKTVPFRIGPGGTSQINITMIPTADGARTATLVIEHTGDNSPLSVMLHGTGQPIGTETAVLYRVDVGGPQRDAADSGPDWEADTGASPSSYTNAAAADSRVFTTNSTISLLSSVPAGTPAALFQTERFDRPVKEEMQWNFPVPSGKPYEVHLYFAELYFTQAGRRAFDVVIEGQTVLSNYDQFVDAGGNNRGVMKSFTTTVHDGQLTIEFLHRVENPAVKAIEIVALDGSGDPPPDTNTRPDIASIADQSVEEGRSLEISVSANDPDGDPIALSVADLPAFGSFSDHGDGSGTLAFAPPPGSAGSYPITVTASDGDLNDTEEFSLQITEPDLPDPGDGNPVVLYRIDAGGPALSSTDEGPNWAIDSGSSPSSYSNVAEADSRTFTTSSTITLTGSVPQGTPIALFRTERYDRPVKAEMQWNFPVESEQQYEIRLYFAELYFGSAGRRVFDVAIEGQTVLSNFDQFVEAGGLNRGFMKSFTTTVSDGHLTIDFVRKAQNPAVKGIEVIALDGTGTPPEPEPDVNAEPVLAAVGDQTVVEGAELMVDVSASDPDGDPVTLAAADLPAFGHFEDFGDGTGALSLSPPDGSAGMYTITLTASDGEQLDSETVSVEVTEAADDGGSSDIAGVLYRIDAGGPSVASQDEGPDWSMDTAGSPSSFSNFTDAGSRTYTANAAITLSSSVPSGTPATLFQSERYDRPRWAEMQWNFPVASGKQYEVRLYFAELYFQASGKRVFDVAIEGETVLENFDQFVDAGGTNRGVMKSFTTTVADDQLTIDFTRKIENPAVKGIEILTVGDGSSGGVARIAEASSTSALAPGEVLKDSVASSLEEIPAELALHPNYPNPFNPRTIITLDLPDAGLVRVSVYDAIGRELAVLADGEMRAGKHTLEWDAGRFASGVYFLRMQASGRQFVRTMLLQK